jgi:hypothetical protein
MCGGLCARSVGRRRGQTVIAASCPPPLRVVKLGGSLLDLCDWSDRLRAWRATQRPARDIIVVGGGTLVDELRAAQIQTGFSDEAAHWRAIDLMSQNARAVCKTLSDVVWTDDLKSIEDVVAVSQPVVFDPANFLHSDTGSGALPANWHVTSDSIAARVAQCCGARELVLLKSALPPADCSRADLAASGYADRFFARSVAEVPIVRCVNLRAAQAPSVVLAPAAARVRA